MEFQILASKFRTLEHSVLGLLKSDKTNEEFKEEFLELEKKIKAEIRRDGALPQGIVQKLLDDFQRVREILKIGTASIIDKLEDSIEDVSNKLEEVAEEIKETIEETTDKIEEKIESVVEAVEEKIEEVTEKVEEKIETAEKKATKKSKKVEQ